MLASDNLREGRLAEALADLQSEIKKKPADAKLRTFLFQLLSVSGDWERAATQLAVVGEMDAQTLPMVQTYREALRCEALRARIFAGDKTPLIFGDPEDWLARLIEAARLTAQGHHAQAEAMRGEALEQAPAVPGELDGQPFEWIADADSRLGPVCEAIINGKYYWVPFHRLQAIALEPPSDLRDVVWMPARLTFANGGESVALIPTRYPGSERHADSFIRLARKTDWVQQGESTYVGVGQRMFATDQGEYALMDARHVALRPPAAPQEG